MSQGSKHYPVKESCKASWMSASTVEGMPCSVKTTCKVCGDFIGDDSHFDFPSCTACSSFFRRSIGSGARYACRANRNCPITKKTRNRCQYCRLQKCFVVGMKKEGVQEIDLPKDPTECKPSLQQSSNGWTPPTTYVHMMRTHPQVVPSGMIMPPMSFQFVPAGFYPQFMSLSTSRPGFIIYPGQTVPAINVEQEQKNDTQKSPSHSYASSVHSDSGIDSHKDDDSTISDVSSVFSGKSLQPFSPPSPSSSQSSSNQSLSTPQELASRSTSVAEPPSPNTLPSKHEARVLDQIEEEDSDHPPARKESFLGGPDAPLPDLDLDELCKSHRSIHTMPEKKQSEAGSIGMAELIKNGKASFVMFVKWIKGIPLFTNLPVVDRVSCVKACYVEQLILTIVYRSLILQSKGMVMGSGKEFKAEEVEHSLISYSIGRIMSELMGNFKSLDLDYKEFICLRLLFLFNPDASGIESPMKQHILRIQDVVLVALEDYCTEQYPTMPLRYSKLLLSMASMRSIGQEMTQEVEIQKALASANFDSSQLFQFLDF